MSEAIAVLSDPQTTPPPEPTGEALRRELAELLEADLLHRFASAGPRERALIETVAELGAGLAHLTRMLCPGCDPRVAHFLFAHVDRVTRGLQMLGTDRIAGTFAEQILIAAMEREGVALALLPAAGRA